MMDQRRLATLGTLPVVNWLNAASLTYGTWGSTKIKWTKRAVKVLGVANGAHSGRPEDVIPRPSPYRGGARRLPKKREYTRSAQSTARRQQLARKVK